MYGFVFYFSFQLPVNLVFAKIQRLEFVLVVSNRNNSATNEIEIIVRNKTNANSWGKFNKTVRPSPFVFSFTVVYVS